MIRRPPRSTLDRSSAASDVYKRQVINHHMDVPFKVLEHSYGFDNGTQTDAETKSGNKIIHGDNLEALKSLLPEYEGRIDCIYICLLYTSDAADERSSVDLGGRRIIKKKKIVRNVIGVSQ